MFRYFADLGFRWKITLPVAGLALLLVLMGGLGLRGIAQVADTSKQLATSHLRQLPCCSMPIATSIRHW